MPTFDSTDFDSAASENGVAHESVANSDHGNASAIVLGNSYSNPPDVSNCEIVYPHDENSGTTLYDVLNGNNASMSGVTVGQTGDFGTNAHFYDWSNNNAQANLGYNPFAGNSAFTMVLVTNIDSSGEGPIISDNQVAAIQDRNSKGYWRFLIGDGSNWGSTVQENVDLATLGVTFLAARFNGGTDLSLWRDGQQRASSTPSESSVGTNSTNMMINNWAPTAGGGEDQTVYFAGLWNSYLSDSQLQELEYVWRSGSPQPVTLAEMEQVEGLGAYDDNDADDVLFDPSSIGWASSFYEHGYAIYESGASNPWKWYTTAQDGTGGTPAVLTSSDGYSWSDPGGQPMSITGGGYEDPIVIPPADHSVDDSTYYMFCERNSDDTTVRFESTDPLDISNNETQVLTKGSSGSWDDRNVASPTPFEYNGTWYLVYEGLPETGDDLIGVATASSVDASSFSKSADNPIIDGNNLPNASLWYATIVPDRIFQRESDGRWFMTIHGWGDNSVRHKGVLYTDVDPPNWSSTSDWDEIDGNPVVWDNHGDTSNHAHPHTEWIHPDTGHVHTGINHHKQTPTYQHQMYQAGKYEGDLITRGKTL